MIEQLQGYVRLVELYPLRRIASDEELEEAMDMSGWLGVQDHAKFDDGEWMYVSALNTLIDHYESTSKSPYGGT